jgi:uncharacterized protein YnzC (UPF0291/DUF896 family)
LQRICSSLGGSSSSVVREFLPRQVNGSASTQFPKKGIYVIKNSAVSIVALILCLGLFTALPVSAQPAAGTARQAGVSEHQQMMRDMMKEMSDELRETIKDMKEDMKGGDVTSEKMKQMDEHMRRVAIMMTRLSGAQDEMFKQMEEMKRDPSMKYPAK